MKKVVIVGILYTAFCHNACPPLSTGQRLWNIAAAALTTIDGVESNLEALITIVHNDFMGTFSVTADLADNLVIAQELTNDIISVADQLIIVMQHNLSLTDTIENELNIIVAMNDALDISGVFTALQGLSQDMSTQLQQAAAELEQIESNLNNLTQSEIDHSITINSQLTVLQTDVDLLNSVLDYFSIIETIAIGSSLDLLSSLINALETNVNMLQSELATGFAGTFTALDAQNATATTVQSLAEDILNESATAFDGLLSSLELLHDSVIIIDSLVDQLSNIMGDVTTIESLIDHALTEVTDAAHTIASLPDQAETIISKLESIESIEIDLLLSDIDSTITLVSVLNSKADIIISKISEIDVADNLSALEFISTELIITESQLDTINFATSKLVTIDSQLDTLNGTALTIESIIDALDQELHNMSNILSISQVALLASELDQIVIETVAINSKLDLINDNLAITHDLLDVSILLSASTLAQLFTMESTINIIESEIDGITFDMHALNSRLEVIEQQSFTISSKLDVAISLTDNLTVEAEELIGDFEQTWTIIQAIDNSLSTIESLLQIPHTFQASVDVSGVYTTINAIIAREATVNTQVDTYTSLVDALNTAITVDFNGIFTALATVEPISTSLIDKINSEVNISLSYLGIPIYQSMLGTTGYTITSPGRYYLAEDITFNPPANFTAAINTSGINNVTIDLNQKILQLSTGNIRTGAGIQGNNINNVRIINGTINEFNTNSILMPNCSNIIIEGVTTSNSGFEGILIGSTSVSNLVICKCKGFNNTVPIRITRTTVGNRNISIKDCYVTKNGNGFMIQNFNNMCCKNLIATNCGQWGILNDLGKNVVIEDCIAIRNISIAAGQPMGGIVLRSGASGSIDAKNGTIKNCITSRNNQGIAIEAIGATSNILRQCCIINNKTIQNNNYGITVELANSPRNNAFLFNEAINNGVININETASDGPNTFLGNFAFNTMAVGNPPNTNYRMANSNITGKFATCSQRGSFGSMPAEWININMLP